MSKHAKGPWFMEFPDKFEDCIITSESRNGMIEICSMKSVYSEMTPSCKFEDEQLANAKLIVAAPDLLKALEQIAAYPKTRADELGASSMRDIARTAIAKAKSES